MVQQILSRLARILYRRFLLIWSENIFKLFIAYPQEKSCLPSWFTMIHMFIEEIFSLHQSTTLGFPNFSLMNASLGKFSNVIYISVSSSSSSTITTFCEGLFSLLKTWFSLKIKLEKYKNSMSADVVSSILLHIYLLP